MDRSKRNTLLFLGMIGFGYVGIRNAPNFIPQRLNFVPVDKPAGFRRFSAGESSSAGYDPFVGLSGTDASAEKQQRQEAEARVSADICGSLYRGLEPGPDQVPVASFSDYYCPFCRVQTKRLAALAKSRPDDILVAWHELPLLGERSNLAAKAALAAKRQGAYVEFHDRLMKSAFSATPEYLSQLSKDIGVDEATLIADMGSPAIAQELQDSAALSRLFAFVGTPALVIGRTIIQGQVNDRTIDKIIALEREEGWSRRCATV